MTAKRAFALMEETEHEFGVCWKPHPSTDLRLAYLDDTDEVSRAQRARGEQHLVRHPDKPWFIAR